MELLDGLILLFCALVAFVFVRYEMVYIDTVWRGYGVKHRALAIITSTSVKSENNDAICFGFVSRDLVIRILKNMASLFFLFFVIAFLYSLVFTAKEIESSFFLESVFYATSLLVLFSGSLILLPLFFSKKFWYLSKDSASNYYNQVFAQRYREAYLKRTDIKRSKEEIERLVRFDLIQTEHLQARYNMIKRLESEGWVK
jgi:hypothetical protein